VSAPAAGGATAEDVRDHFEEHSAFLEFDCLLPRDAERQALAETARDFGLTIEQPKRAIAQAKVPGDE
jgi:hypothetical protein